jgi:PAS domain S-box-containing protein
VNSASASPNTVVTALSTQAESYGRLSVTSAAPVPIDIVDGLQTLGAQVALALESVAINERFNEDRREAWVGALVQNATDVILVLDARLRIRYVTPSVLDALGHDPGDLVGVSVLDLVEPTEEPALTAFLSPERRPGDSERAEWRIRRGDGSFTDVEVVRTDLLKNPSVNGIVVTARDITERVALQAGLERQVRELEELSRIKSDFVAAVSHELRTPLACIIGEVEMLADGDLGDLTERQARSAEVVGRNSERLLSLIDDLLILSRIESNEICLNRAPTPVDGLVEDMRSLIASAAEAKSVDLSLECGSQPESVFVDREQMGRALANLLTNAVKFTPPGGNVHLRARREGENLVVTVADTGMGIPLDEQARLFTRFFRSSAATRMAIQGTGLGLVIVKKIVEEHGGTISVASVPDQGTTVTVKVPAEGKDVSADAA